MELAPAPCLVMPLQISCLVVLMGITYQSHLLDTDVRRTQSSLVLTEASTMRSEEITEYLLQTSTALTMMCELCLLLQETCCTDTDTERLACTASFIIFVFS